MRNLFFFLILSLLLSCSNEKGYELVSFGTTGHVPKVNEAILYVIELDSIKEYDVMYPNSEGNLKDLLFSSEQNDILRILDEKKFELPANSLVYSISFNDSNYIHSIQGLVGEFEKDEKNQLWNYLFESKIKYECFKGMFVKWKHRSKSEIKGVKNSIYRLDMECSLLNGERVFSTDLSNSLFEFNKSMPGQVTDGLALIIDEMSQGDEVEIVVPSNLSFGEKGMGNGIIPPNSPLVYNLKLIEIII